MRVLAGGIECVFAGTGIKFTQCSTRLHRIWCKPVIDEIHLGDMGCIRKSSVNGFLVTQFPVIALIARCFFMDLRGTGGEGFADICH